MGRVIFTPKAEPTKAGPAKAGPAIDWSEIESRLQEISTGPQPSDLPIEPSVTLANDPPAASDPPVTSDWPAIHPGDPLDLLSLLTSIPSKRY